MNVGEWLLYGFGLFIFVIILVIVNDFLKAGVVMNRETNQEPDTSSWEENKHYFY